MKLGRRVGPHGIPIDESGDHRDLAGDEMSSSRPDLRLIHRRVRHARSGRGEGAAWRVICRGATSDWSLLDCRSAGATLPAHRSQSARPEEMKGTRKSRRNPWAGRGQSKPPSPQTFRSRMARLPWYDQIAVLFCAGKFTGKSAEGLCPSTFCRLIG